MSSLLGLFSKLPLAGEPDPAEAIGGRLVAVAGKRSSPEAQVCLHALAAVAPTGLARRARTALARLAPSKHPAPAWLELIGRARATCAWRASDYWGNQDSIMFGFSYPTGAEHCLVVLVDHVLGGIAKDAAILDCEMEVLLEGWDEPEFVVIEEPVSGAAARVMAAVAATVSTPGAPITEDFIETLALLRARVGRLGEEATRPLGPAGPASVCGDR